jgi:nucleoside-diphosphate-sugar epimerase
MKKVLLTGASGFLGSNISKALTKIGFLVTEIYREDLKKVIEGNAYSVRSLVDYDIFIHCAGLAHQRSCDQVSIKDYQNINTDLTIKLAYLCVRLKIKHFIYISSLSVYNIGNNNFINLKSLKKPHTNYGLSKLEAEIKLMKLFDESELFIHIVRPPMIYGKNAPGNYARLNEIAKKGYFVPKLSSFNRRTFVSLFNVLEFIEYLTITLPQENTEAIVADKEPVSTDVLLEHLYGLYGHSNRLINVPYFMQRALKNLLRKHNAGKQYFGNLEITEPRMSACLKWEPTYDMESSFRSIRKMEDNF